MLYEAEIEFNWKDHAKHFFIIIIYIFFFISKCRVINYLNLWKKKN